VGYGYWGSKHVRVLQGIPDVEVTVVDSSPARLAEARAAFPAAGAARQLDEVLADLDSVVVATPPGSHGAVALPALQAAKHTLVEKPLATSVADAELLVETASVNDVRLMVGHTFEYNAAVWKLKEIINSGTLGRVFYIDAARLSLGLYQNDIDVVWDLAPHDISIVTYLLDELPESVSVWTQRNIGVHADVAYLRLEFAQARTLAFIHVSWLDPCKVRRLTVVGEQKMAVYNDLSDNERIRIYDVGVDQIGMDADGATHAMPVTYRTGDILSPHVSFREPLLVQDSHFINCIRTGRRPDTPGERGVDIVRVLAAADRAKTNGRSAISRRLPLDLVAVSSAPPGVGAAIKAGL
jgi:Predicted dehydrogenases and related proteins